MYVFYSMLVDYALKQVQEPGTIIRFKTITRFKTILRFKMYIVETKIH